ncbi:1,4-alpha-glucan branching protein GlgB [Kitasatospora sp. NPDC004289]
MLQSIAAPAERPASGPGPLDLHLLAEGKHQRLWEVLGAHPGTDASGRPGVSFTLWAPRAHEVAVAGQVTGGRAPVPLRRIGTTDYWTVFVPGAEAGQRYRFELLGADGVRRAKADPCARSAPLPPGPDSVVHASDHHWGDREWMIRRAAADPRRRPLSVYEVHLGSWRPGLSYRQLAVELTAYVREQGFTHVELLPVMEHPYGGSWGYQVTGFYAPSSRFGSPDDFRHLIDSLHRAGIGVILDWVPAHFPRDDFALGRFDGHPLYEHPDPRRGEHPDWGTLVFDYGRPEVANFLIANALYWCEEFHVDGLRVDAVASMLYLDYSRPHGQWEPNQQGGRENLEAVAFLRSLNEAVHGRFPGVLTIAEESTTWPGVTAPLRDGGLGFDFKWNLGWMHDTLDYFQQDPVYREHHHHGITFSTTYAWTENFVLPLSHDEVVHGKGSLRSRMPGDEAAQLANVRAMFGLMWALPGKNLLFMGGENGDQGEWSEAYGLQWPGPEEAGRLGVRQLVSSLNRAYRDTPALWAQDPVPEGFQWLDADDAGHNVYAFLRRAPDGTPLVCVANLSGATWDSLRIGLPRPGRWHVLLDTDPTAARPTTLRTTPTPHHAQPWSAELHLPALSTCWLVATPPGARDSADLRLRRAGAQGNGNTTG